MPAVGETLRVEGLRELDRAFKLADRQLQRDLRTRLRQVAEPVRVTAQGLAVAAIPRVTVPWAQMRVGVTAHSVYVAPKHRGTRQPTRRRPNFAGLLLHRAMEPALAVNVRRVEAGMEDLLGDVGRTWENA